MISLRLYASYREAFERKMKVVLTTNKALKTCRRKQNTPVSSPSPIRRLLSTQISTNLASFKQVCRSHYSKHHLVYCICFSNRYSTLRDSNCNFFHCITPRTEKATNIGVWLCLFLQVQHRERRT